MDPCSLSSEGVASESLGGVSPVEMTNILGAPHFAGAPLCS